MTTLREKSGLAFVAFLGYSSQGTNGPVSIGPGTVNGSVGGPVLSRRPFLRVNRVPQPLRIHRLLGYRRSALPTRFRAPPAPASVNGRFADWETQPTPEKTFLRRPARAFPFTFVTQLSAGEGTAFESRQRRTRFSPLLTAGLHSLAIFFKKNTLSGRMGETLRSEISKNREFGRPSRPNRLPW